MIYSLSEKIKTTFHKLSKGENFFEILRGAGIAFAFKILGACLVLGFNVLVARFLGPVGAGQFILAHTIVIIASVFGRMGLDNVILRFVAFNNAKTNIGAMKDVYRKGMIIGGCASTIAAVIIFLLAPLLCVRIFNDPNVTVPLRWMCFAIVFYSISILHSEALKGLKKISSAIFLMSISVPLFSLFTVPFLAEKHGVKGVAWAYSAATLITLAIAFLLWRKNTNHLIGDQTKFSTKILIKTGLPLFWVSSMNILINRISAFFLGIWRPTAEVGIYGIAQQTAMLTSFVLLAVNSIAAPKFSELYAKNKMKELEKVAKGSTILMTALAAPILLFFLVFPDFIMAIYGTSFKEGSLALSILAIGQFVNVITGSVGYLLIMCGHEKHMRNIIILTAILTVILNLIFIPLWGYVGAAFATALSLSFQNIFAFLIVRKKIGVSTFPGSFFKICQ